MTISELAVTNLTLSEAFLGRAQRNLFELDLVVEVGAALFA